jgi:hypothetical protein
MPEISSLKEDHGFKSSLGYREFLLSLGYIKRPCLTKQASK